MLNIFRETIKIRIYTKKIDKAKISKNAFIYIYNTILKKKEKLKSNIYMCHSKNSLH